MIATIRVREPVTDTELLRISGDNPGWQVERDADGAVIMSPNSSRNSRSNLVLSAQLFAYERRGGGKSFGPDAGFTMPDTSVLSPDGSWVESSRWEALSPAEQGSYSPLVPDVCIDLVSKTDSQVAVRRKLLRYRGYGARYVVMIDRNRRETWTDGEPPEGFSLDFGAIFDA